MPHWQNKYQPRAITQPSRLELCFIRLQQSSCNTLYQLEFYLEFSEPLLSPFAQPQKSNIQPTYSAVYLNPICTIAGLSGDELVINFIKNKDIR